METQTIVRLLFLVFLLTAAIQDLREKQVKIWVFVLFGFLAFLMVGKSLCWQEHLQCSCLGLGLLAVGKISGGEIGAGDGLFFLVSGYLLSFGENLIMLCGGIMLCGLYGMIIFVWYRIRTKTIVGKKTIAFLPFVAVWEIGLTAIQFLG